MLDFNWRFHDASIGRFFVVDRLSEKFSYMTPYQFASNDPVNRIELDGLEGIRHDEVYQNNGGKNFIKTVVDVNVHVGLSKDGYVQSDVSAIKSGLEQQYNRDFKVDGNKVEFRFNMQTFNADKVSLQEKAAELRKTSTVDASSPTIKEETTGQPLTVKAVTAYAIAIDPSMSTDNTLQGSTNINGTRINPNAEDIRHTEAHEIGHFMLNGNTANPNTPSQHNTVGGIFRYKTVDENGIIIQGTQNVNRQNVQTILRTMPIRKD